MKAIPLPESRQQLLVEDPLYTRYSLDETDWAALIRRALENGSLDAFCPECERVSVFRVESGYGRDELAQKLAVKTWFTVEARCTRDHRTQGAAGRCDGRLVVLFARDGRGACKAGIHPPKSVLDLAALDAATLSELDPDLREDLGRAIGLRADGVGAGAFVYLRRVLGVLLEEARLQASAAPGWNAARFGAADASERIRLLARQLPAKVVESAPLFSLLDRGAHELDEADALAYFDLFFQAIALILRERVETRTYAGAAAKAALARSAAGS